VNGVVNLHPVVFNTNWRTLSELCCLQLARLSKSEILKQGFLWLNLRGVALLESIQSRFYFSTATSLKFGRCNPMSSILTLLFINCSELNFLRELFAIGFAYKHCNFWRRERNLDSYTTLHNLVVFHNIEVMSLSHKTFHLALHLQLSIWRIIY